MANAEASRPTYNPFCHSGISWNDATIFGKYGDIEFNAVCSARDSNASKHNCFHGNGVAWYEESSDPSSVVSSSFLEDEARNPSGPTSDGVFGGGVGKVWY
jgi:hypothetical protein